MRTEKIIEELEKAWEIPDGLFWGLRNDGIFNIEKFENFVKLLESIEISGDQINRRLVSLLWYIPLFMGWQEEIFLEQNGEVRQLKNAIDKITSILQEKLGVP